MQQEHPPARPVPLSPAGTAEEEAVHRRVRKQVPADLKIKRDGGRVQSCGG